MLESRIIPLDKVVVDRSSDSMTLIVAGTHHGKVSVGRLMTLNVGANIGASQKYTAEERTLDTRAASRPRKME